MYECISKNLEFFRMMTADQIYNERKNKFLKIGRSKGFMENVDDLSSLDMQKENFIQTFKNNKYLIPTIGIILFFISFIFLFLIEPHNNAYIFFLNRKNKGSFLFIFFQCILDLFLSPLFFWELNYSKIH